MPTAQLIGRSAALALAHWHTVGGRWPSSSGPAAVTGRRRSAARLRPACALRRDRSTHGRKRCEGACRYRCAPLCRCAPLYGMGSRPGHPGPPPPASVACELPCCTVPAQLYSWVLQHYGRPEDHLSHPHDLDRRAWKLRLRPDSLHLLLSALGRLFASWTLRFTAPPSCTRLHSSNCPSACTEYCSPRSHPRGQVRMHASMPSADGMARATVHGVPHAASDRVAAGRRAGTL